MSKQSAYPPAAKEFNSFAEFYPFYLGEHSNRTCRVLHYTGTLSAISIISYAIWSSQYSLIPLAFVAAYGQAWIGHFFFEHNKPATFKYPLWSFMGDWVMIKDFLTGRIKQKMPQK